MEKDYITRTQKQYEAYYQSAFNTQIWVLSITGFTLATMFFLAGRFGFDNRCPASHGKPPDALTAAAYSRKPPGGRSSRRLSPDN